MATQLVCDCCVATTPDTEEGKREWIGVTFHKVQVSTSIVKDFDLCPTCAERVRAAMRPRSNIGN